MRICCPNCLTLYDIDRKSLDHAAGMANCYRCHQVFNAFENKMADDRVEDPAPSPAALTDEPAATAAESPEPGVAPKQEPESPADTAAAGGNVAVADRGGAVQMDIEELIDRATRELDLATGLTAADQPPEADDAPVESPDLPEPDDTPAPPFPQPGDIPAETPAAPASEDNLPAGFDEFHPAHQNKQESRSTTGRKFILGLGILVFSLAAAAQLSWLHWERVSTHPQGQKLIQQVCDWLSCELPLRRSPDRFVILQRDLKPVLDPPGALALQILLSNDADFAQPAPVLELTFLDYDNTALARRRFQPHEYLSPASAAEKLITPREPVSIEMLLLDPGPQAAGFRLEFL